MILLSRTRSEKNSPSMGGSVFLKCNPHTTPGNTVASSLFGLVVMVVWIPLGWNNSLQ